MRFSIIIPVYNVEKFIDKCLETVMGQSFQDYEVIVVNDETPDNSMAIVQKYVDAYPGKIQVIHQKNTRQGGARNHGVQYATGEYLLFVDSDDYVAQNLLETVDARLKEHPCDILVFHHVPVTREGKQLPCESYGDFEAGVYCPAENTKVVMLPVQPWNKAFRREFYVDTQFQFPEKILYEDGATRLLCAMASSIAVCDDILYYYVQSTNSSIRRSISEKMLDILTVTDLTVQEFQKRDLYEKFQYPLECALIYGILYIFDSINAVQPEHPIQIPMAEYIREHFPDYRQNPYASKTLCAVLDDLTAQNFRRYHFRVQVIGRMKEQILRIPLADKLIKMCKRSLNIHSN